MSLVDFYAAIGWVALVVVLVAYFALDQAPSRRVTSVFLLASSLAGVAGVLRFVEAI